MHGRVTSTEQLTPGMVRVVLGGGDLEHLAMPDATDAYVNLAFPPAAASYDEVFDPQRSARSSPGGVAGPAPLHRAVWDAETRELILDFVVHGDEGVAGPLGAQRPARRRARLRGARAAATGRPRAADWHLMVGDESALPADRRVARGDAVR